MRASHRSLRREASEPVTAGDERNPGGKESPPARPRSQRRPIGAGEISRILLADDDPAHCRLIRITIASPHLALTEVEDGEAAVNLIAMRPFDLVILSARMPRWSGAETLAWIRRNYSPWSDIPVLGLFAKADRTGVGEMLALGMTSWISKPVQPADLRASLLRLLPGLPDTSA